MYKVYFYITLLYISFNFSLTSVWCANNGIKTPPNTGTKRFLKEIFIGRCYDFQTTSTYDRPNRPVIDCDNLYNIFIAPFKGLEECQEKAADYSAFFKEVQEEIPPNKGIFWSRTSTLVHDMANKGTQYITLENTLPGYLANEMTWCGQIKDPGMNYDQCLRTCPGEEASVNYEYWIQASTNFAKSVSGVVTLLLDGSLNPDKGIFAFNEKSILAKYELPNFRKEKVTKVQAILVHPLGIPKTETCNSSSMLKLKNRVLERGFPYECLETPTKIKLLLCARKPNAAECKDYF